MLRQVLSQFLHGIGHIGASDWETLSPKGTVPSGQTNKALITALRMWAVLPAHAENLVLHRAGWIYADLLMPHSRHFTSKPDLKHNFSLRVSSKSMNILF